MPEQVPFNTTWLLMYFVRYLIPCNHVMVSQRRAVRDLDIYGKTAEKFLSLKPSCCNNEDSDTSSVEEGSTDSR